MRKTIKKIGRRIKRKLGVETPVEKVDHRALVAEFLAVKEVQPGRCDPKIFKSGEFFCILAGPRSWLIEAWVAKVRDIADAKIDWHMAGGRACVYYLGGQKALKRLAEAANATKPAFEEVALVTSEYSFVRNGDHPAVQWMSTPWGQVPT